MMDRIVSTTVENVETGEITDMGTSYFFPTGSELAAIVMVKGVESYGPYSDSSTIQIDVSCKALDAAGMPFNLDANFYRHTQEEKVALLSAIQVDSLHIFFGQYGVDSDGSISLTDPEYSSVEPQFKEDEVREAFRINAEHRNHVAQLDREKP